MPLFHVIILAIVQGVTEFLPVSSSAHLALAPWLLGWKDPGLTFDIALHFGTLAAVLIYFFRDWVQIIAQGFGFSYPHDAEIGRSRRLLWLLLAATVPVGVVGLLFKDYVETVLRSPFVIGSMLIAIGLLMGLADRAAKCRKGVGEVSFFDAMVIGVFQALAIVPGTSRSGITITAALFRDLRRSPAARFSFLLSTPTIGGAALLAFLDLMKQGGIPADMRVPFAVGVAISAATGCMVIRYFLRFLNNHTLKFFVAYRIIFGIMVLALAIFRLPAG